MEELEKFIKILLNSIISSLNNNNYPIDVIDRKIKLRRMVLEQKPNPSHTNNTNLIVRSNDDTNNLAVNETLLKLSFDIKLKRGINSNLNEKNYSINNKSFLLIEYAAIVTNPTQLKIHKICAFSTDPPCGKLYVSFPSCHIQMKTALSKNQPCQKST